GEHGGDEDGAPRPPSRPRRRDRLLWQTSLLLSTALTGPRYGQRGKGRLSGVPDPDLVEVGQEIGRVVIDTVGAGPFQLLAAIAARQQPHPQRPGPPGGQQVPDRAARAHRGGHIVAA